MSLIDCVAVGIVLLLLRVGEQDNRISRLLLALVFFASWARLKGVQWFFFGGVVITAYLVEEVRVTVF